MCCVAKPLPGLLLETIVSPGNFIERFETTFLLPSPAPSGQQCGQEPSLRGACLQGVQMYSHTGTAWKQSDTFVFSSPESGATFLFPTQEKVHRGKEKQAGGFPLSEAPGSALNLLQPFGKGRSSPSWQSVGTGSQIAWEGGKESQHRLLSPHTHRLLPPAAALGSVTRPPNSRVWDWVFHFWKGQGKELLPTFLSV